MNSSFNSYGLLGYPLRHSLSPKMHNRVFKELGIPATYELFEIKPPDLSNFLKSLRSGNIHGFNVTIPYKQKILEYVAPDEESLAIRDIGAVNTVINSNGILKGFNTDYIGFGMHLKDLGINPQGKRVALLGAGGGARAVTYSLISSRVSSISVFDIDPSRVDSLIEMAKKIDINFAISRADDIENLDIKNKDLLVNATPVGLKKEDPCLIKDEVLNKDQFVYDLIYNPPETRLLKLAKEKGTRVSNGLGMLIYQGARAFKYFTDTKVSIEEIAGIMKKALMEE
ncbi:MAG: shikimate dehydrogenase [Candidatus Omnitrophica bacterium]|nr:shikimate dehydrogenase [Candidatus Omnitrophota bacterium]MBD3268793.1 shikimate dehydrogenase [Candidatus Omnitrophota bacterium]